MRQPAITPPRTFGPTLPLEGEGGRSTLIGRGTPRTISLFLVVPGLAEQEPGIPRGAGRKSSGRSDVPVSPARYVLSPRHRRVQPDDPCHSEATSPGQGAMRARHGVDRPVEPGDDREVRREGVRFIRLEVPGSAFGGPGTTARGSGRMAAGVRGFARTGTTGKPARCAAARNDREADSRPLLQPPPASRCWFHARDLAYARSDRSGCVGAGRLPPFGDHPTPDLRSDPPPRRGGWAFDPDRQGYATRGLHRPSSLRLWRDPPPRKGKGGARPERAYALLRFQPRPVSPKPSQPSAVTAMVSSILMKPRFGWFIVVSIDSTMPSSSGRSLS